MINEDILNSKTIDNLRKQFAANKPFPHILIKNFLQEGKAKQTLAALKKEEFEEKDSDLFQFRQTDELAYSSNKNIKDFHDFMSSAQISELIQEISGIKLKKGKIDMFGSLYIDTDYLLCHDDELDHRKIAYVYYLCDDFNANDGGALALLSDDKGKADEVVKRVYPQWNSLIIFAVSKKSWHEVEEVLSTKKRYAIGGWFH